jgi:hypothetical protein
LDAALPSAIAPTVYARFGDTPIAIILAAALLFVVRRRGAKPIPWAFDFVIGRRQNYRRTEIESWHDDGAVRILSDQAHPEKRQWVFPEHAANKDEGHDPDNRIMI